MKTAKRILVVLAVVALLVGALAVSSFAATGDVNTADFTGPNAGTSYNTKVTATSGWVATNVMVLSGGSSNASPKFSFISSDTNYRAFCLNGKTSAKGTITSPTLTGGIDKLTFNYGLPFSDNKIGIKITVTDSNGVSQTETVTKTSASKTTAYSHSWQLATPISGNFTIKFENTSPSGSTSNKDRTAIWNVQWTSYEANTSASPSDMLEAEAERVNLPTEIKKDTTIQLPIKGASYEEVSISWSCDSEYVTIDENGIATIKVPVAGGEVEEATISLDAAFSIDGAETYYDSYTIKLISPLTEAEIVDAAFALTTSGAALADGPYTLTGVISKIVTAYSTTNNYNNITVDMTVYNTAGEAKTIQCFRLCGMGADAIKVGDEITVTGNIKNYNGTIEFDAGCTLDKYPHPVAVDGVSLNIADNIDVYYYVTAPGFKSATASFVFDGKTTTATGTKLTDGRIKFVFEGINPAQLGDAINATFSVKYATYTYTAKNDGMSVKKYYEMAQAYEGTKNDTALMTLLSDLLVYGAAAQTYVGDTDALVTEGLTLTPSTNAIPESVFTAEGDAFKSIGLELGSDITVALNVALKEGDVVNVYYNDRCTSFAEADLEADENGIYTVRFADVYASDYAATITVELNGNILKYSVNSYINEMANSENANLAALVAALNNYGASAAAYKNA